VLSTLDYGLHLDMRPYVQRLSDHARRLGVRRSEGRVAEKVSADGGAIAAVRLEAGAELSADLFLDCSGSAAVLIGEAPGARWQDWSRHLPFDRMVDTVVEEPAAPAPFNETSADETGWLRRTPTQGATGLAYVYGSRFLDDATADGRLRRLAGASPDAEPRRSILRSGRRASFWRANCIALGAAAASLGPLESANLRIVQSGLSRLIALFPHRTDNAAAAAEYDRLMASEIERVRDLVVLHALLNRRAGEALWDACRAAEAPDSLAYKLDLFESRARFAPIDEEPFPPSAWTSVLLGQGVRPRRYDRLADAIDKAGLETTLAQMGEAMAQAVRTMPSHADVLRACCAGYPLEAAG